MSRILHAGETPAKRRRAHTRSCAEALRLLAQRPALADGAFDTEARDLTAFLAFHLRGIGRAIESSAQSWDDRGYWKKAEALREEYRWTRWAAEALEEKAVAGQWAETVPTLVELVPRFADVNVSKLTRDADHWVGAYRALVRKAERAA